MIEKKIIMKFKKAKVTVVPEGVRLTAPNLEMIYPSLGQALIQLPELSARYQFLEKEELQSVEEFIHLLQSNRMDFLGRIAMIVSRGELSMRERKEIIDSIEVDMA